VDAVRAEYRVVAGSAGWELASITTTVETWVNRSGNDLVAVFKPPSPTPPDLAFEPAEVIGERPGWT
jgi:hypothetical protein